MSLIRLDKYLADAGIGTRSEVKKLLKKNLITVNDESVSRGELKIDTDKDIVKYMNKLVIYQEYEYYMLNKPAGYVSACTDNLYPTVISLIKSSKHKGLFPVGRLDLDTEGLLIITDDGETSHNLLSPNKHVDKCYYVELDKDISSELINDFKTGIDIGEDKLTKPAFVEQLSPNTCNITISEGKYHQIKRMFLKYGLRVTYLKRLSMGALSLDKNLKIGEYRALTKDEINALINS